MKRILCKTCREKILEGPGTREYLPAGRTFPAEWERLVYGAAKTPTKEQRTVYLNNVPHGLPVDHWNCDNCGAEIHPGDECACWTVWHGDTPEPEAWEEEFIASHS